MAQRAVNQYPFNPVKAAAALDSAGYIDSNDDGWREDPRSGLNINLQFYVRQDTMRSTLGTWIQNRLVGDAGGVQDLRDVGPEFAGIQVTRFDVDGTGAWTNCMLNKIHDMYTSGWSISRDPTLHYGLFHSKFYWHPGDPPNYNNIHDPALDALMAASVYCGIAEESRTSVLAVQERMNDYDGVFNIPIFTEWGVHAFKKTILNTGIYWKGIINSVGYGPRSAAGWIDSFLNMHPATELPASALPLTIRYGWQRTTMPSSLNPYQYSWVWDADVIFHCYTTLATVNPYNPLGGGPGVASDSGDFRGLIWGWKMGEYDVDPITPGFQPATNMTLYLRKDIVFHDGTPFTAEDYYYGVELGLYMAKDNSGYGWTGLPPWFYQGIMDISYEERDSPGHPTATNNETAGVGVDIVDAYTLRIYYNVQTPYAFWWKEIPVVPKEKWWDVFYPDPTGVDGFAPDPQMIGTGPYQVFPGSVDPPDGVHYSPGNFIKLDKNYRFTTGISPVNFAIPTIPGDLGSALGWYKYDGKVDGFDLTLFLQGFNGMGSGPGYDAYVGLAPRPGYTP